ncbi:hypothetical protein Scep_022518 [Stephania cephalantha]|uniref:Uncharacterized protein n=1 Tax=Stephania cephalantha TaxID=152367 RepID=A0AAP0I2R5_9MAGN
MGIIEMIHLFGMDPGDGAVGVAPLGEYGVANGVDGGGVEGEGGLVAGQQSHQMLVGRRVVEPPLEVRCKEALHRVYVAASQCLIQGFHNPYVRRLQIRRNLFEVGQL